MFCVKNKTQTNRSKTHKQGTKVPMDECEDFWPLKKKTNQTHVPNIGL